ncbi:MAG: SDR family oxidoreductase [Eubacterium sp.]|nr:SDR family oxidoreductase [Eubacterium sp.]
MSNEKTYSAPKVLVTGASSGIGKVTAELFARGGYEVFGVSRSLKPESRRYKNGGILRTMPMDVTNDQSVQRVIDRIGALDVVILAAGMGIAGSCEEVPVEMAREQMEVNYFGILRVVSAILPAMRKQTYGRIIIIGSVGGRVAIPMQSHYSSSKFALEAYSDALRLELKPFGIDVSLIEPGDTRTGFTDNRKLFLPENSPYRETALHAVGVMENDERNGAAPETVARSVLRTARSDHPKAQVVVGIRYKMLNQLIRHVPDRLREYLVGKIYLPM